MKFLKSIKKTMLIISSVYIAIGVLLIIQKQDSNNLIMQLLSIGLLVAGLLSMLRYFMINVKERIKRDDFIVGALLIAISLLIYFASSNMLQIVDKILAIAMIISGFHKIQDMFDSKAAGRGASGIYMFGFMVCMLIGCLVLFEVIKSQGSFYVIVGLGMCICGISDIVSNFYVASCVAAYEKSLNSNIEYEETKQEEVIEDNQVEEIKEEAEDKPLE